MATCLRYARKVISKSIPEQDIDDVVQEVMFSLISIDDYANMEMDRILSLIRIISKRRIADYYRSRDTCLVPLDALVNERAHCFSVGVNEQSFDYITLEKVLKEIPYGEELGKRFDGCTYNEIGEIIGRTKGAARYRCRVALRQLRQRLQ